ncbi:MAG: hypothetical protein EOO20_28770, partial [Chryseobacterium sp.]
MKRVLHLCFSIVVIVHSSSACKTLGNQFNAQVLDCGPGLNNAEFTYAEVFDANGEKLNVVPRDAEAYISSESGERIKLEWTNRSCVAIPLKTKSGLFMLTVPSWKKSSVVNWNGKKLASDVFLNDKPYFEGVLKCPSEGFYVNSTLQNFINLKVIGETNDYELRVVASKRGSNEIYPIFKKNMSDSFSGLPDMYSLERIPEGVYLLKAGSRRPEKLTDDLFDDQQAVFLPGGQAIVFSS